MMVRGTIDSYFSADQPRPAHAALPANSTVPASPSRIDEHRSHRAVSMRQSWFTAFRCWASMVTVVDGITVAVRARPVRS